jgi:hypothetical protein
MLNATHLPIDPYGNLIPVQCSNSRGTQAVTLASNAVVYSSDVFSSKDKVMASASILGAGGEKLTITSNIEGMESEDISVQVAAAGGAIAVTVTDKAILITPTATSTIKEIAGAINEDVKASALVTASYADADEAAILAANQAKQFLSGWDRGGVGILVLIQFTEDGFYGTFSEAETTPMTASIPIPAGVDRWEYVLPGKKISLKSATNGAKAYLTPVKQM